MCFLFEIHGHTLKYIKQRMFKKQPLGRLVQEAIVLALYTT